MSKKNTTKINWEKIAEWQNDNKDLLVMVASPKEDSIAISFGGLNTFVRFPGVDMEKGVVFNALRKSKFEQAIDAFMTGFINSTGISEKDEGGEVLKVLGGSMRAFGEQRSKLSETQKENAKTNKSKNR